MLVDVTGSYTAAPPARCDFTRWHRHVSTTRASVGGVWQANETRAIAVPAGAAAVAINVTITEPAASGFVTVFPCQATLPVVSNINYVAGQVVANLVQTGVRAGRCACTAEHARHIVIDLQGTYDAADDGLRYQAVAPTRLVDTRSGVGSVFGRVAMDARFARHLAIERPVATTAVPGPWRR